MIKAIKKLKEFFHKKKAKTAIYIYEGTTSEIRKGYTELLKQNVEIISTSVTQGYRSYDKQKQFVLMVTFKHNWPH